MKILLISDIHGNAEALRAVMQAERDADASIFLGDAFLSGPQANETLELLSALNPIITIRGTTMMKFLTEYVPQLACRMGRA